MQQRPTEAADPVATDAHEDGPSILVPEPMEALFPEEAPVAPTMDARARALLELGPALAAIDGEETETWAGFSPTLIPESGTTLEALHEPSPASPPVRIILQDERQTLCLSTSASIDELREGLRRAAAAGELTGRSTRIDLGQRELDPFDLSLLLHFLRDELDVGVGDVICTLPALRRQAEREIGLPLTLAEEPVALSLPPVAELEPLPTVFDTAEEIALDPPELPGIDSSRPVVVVSRTVRSGTLVRSKGDIIVYGDVNAGAQLEASGNVVVLGTLRGLAHAGVQGDEGAIIIAFELVSPQVRIGTRIGTRAPLARRRGAPVPTLPQLVHVLGTEVVVEDFRGRLPPPPEGR